MIALITHVLLATAPILALVAANEDKREPSPLWKEITGAPWIHFTLDRDVSDEFDSDALNETKWDPHGLRNENTNCPTWNGPTNYPLVDYSTYFTTTTEPFTRRKIPIDERQYHLKGGMLHLKISKKPLGYFQQREYYCNSTTYHCNFDQNRPCYATDFQGQPILRNAKDPKSYRYINHDKCKREPFCLPHPAHVMGEGRKYGAHVGPNLVGRSAFQYGYIEVNVRVAQASAVSAVWMYDNHMWPSYSRFRRENSSAPIILESPSLIRSRRWQEIDMLEVMNTWAQRLNRLYIPNIHVFAGYHGEFTRARNDDDYDTMGPIVLDESVFQVGRNPCFDQMNASAANSWHLNVGSVHELPEEWAEHFHRVGLYWSPYEIRFVVDGDEVLRLRNTLVHQSMFMVLSMAFNVHWAQTTPSDREIGQEFVVDYVRRWTVQLDVPHNRVPSRLPLSMQMNDTFRSLGNEYLAAENKFPVRNDNKTVELRISKRRDARWVEKHYTNYALRAINQGEPKWGRRRPYHWIADGCDDDVCGMHRTGRKRKLSENDKVILEGRRDRAREPTALAMYNALNSITAYEDIDPNGMGAGWAL